MSQPQIIAMPDPEGIFRYFTHEHAPWDYFQTLTNPDSPPCSKLVDASEDWTVAVHPQMNSHGVSDPVWTGRYELSVSNDDDEQTHPLDGTVYDSHSDGERAAFNAGLTMYRVPC